jgi:acetyl-CoA carboxylase biotin carboxyl carrier protein
MRTSFIRSLIRLVEESDIESLEVSSWGRKVRVVKRAPADENGHGSTHAVVQSTPAPAPNPAPPSASPEPAAAPAAQSEAKPAAAPATEEDTGNLVPVKSPMVGTFYSSPSPDSDPYVSLNQKVAAGQVVCIVEAMKLMNEIESEVSGRIAKILVENAQPVEFGQVLFLIEPD